MPEWLKIMTQWDSRVLRVFTTDTSDAPIGIVELNELNRHFKTARLWGVAGNKSFAARGYGAHAGSKVRTYAFEELGLHAVNTWIVEGNPSVRIMKRLNLSFIGRQCQFHYIDNHAYDRLWFDLLATEHKEMNREVPSRNMDLLETGAPDSLTFVEVLVHLERESSADGGIGCPRRAGPAEAASPLSSKVGRQCAA